jgi:hypothetical protein
MCRAHNEAGAEVAAAADMGLCAEGAVMQKWELGAALTLLAGVFCRSGRVVMAEGLLREACKLLGIARDAAAPWHAPRGCHHSLAARAAWLHAQLLSALPKRGTEAHAWAECARAVAAAGPDGSGAPLEETLGELGALSGAGRCGKAPAVVLWLGRAFPGDADAV